MLRKTFEGHTEEQTQIMMKKTEKLIEEVKKELEAYLNEQTPPRVSIDETDARLSGEFTVDEKVVEGIISRYVIELSDICKVSP